MNGNGWIAVALDGTLAELPPPQLADGQIGAPVPVMVKRVKHWLHDGWDVRVFTPRVSAGSGRARVQARHEIEAWCVRHIGQKLPVTYMTGPNMVELWDARAVTVELNTGRQLAPSIRWPR